MPLYEFHCPKCDKDFTLVLTVSEYEKTKPKCPDCKTEAERIFSSVYAITSKKS